jgi:hypothetical protein
VGYASALLWDISRQSKAYHSVIFDEPLPNARFDVNYQNIITTPSFYASTSTPLFAVSQTQQVSSWRLDMLFVCSLNFLSRLSRSVLRMAGVECVLQLLTWISLQRSKQVRQRLTLSLDFSMWLFRCHSAFGRFEHRILVIRLCPNQEVRSGQHNDY